MQAVGAKSGAVARSGLWQCLKTCVEGALPILTRLRRSPLQDYHDVRLSEVKRCRRTSLDTACRFLSQPLSSRDFPCANVHLVGRRSRTCVRSTQARFRHQKECPTCAGNSGYSHITQDEMKNIMKQAVDTVYKLLWLKLNDPEKYEATLEFGNRYTRVWDEPNTDVD